MKVITVTRFLLRELYFWDVPHAKGIVIFKI